MANEDVKTNVSITLTGKEAENQIEHLKSKAEELRKKLQEAQKALNPDPKEIRRLEQELKAVEKTLSSVTRESKKYEDVLQQDPNHEDAAAEVAAHRKIPTIICLIFI